ncbi:ribbon-helix-helix protein, CopG family [Candidatus Pacearchaeota archaeon]|nr:ribbon-helix-helix protein, CopG family [Candidatus Pacearchaeota archaeon]
MGKERISATIDPATKRAIDSIMKKGNYRNKAHLIEEAIKILIKKEKGR